MLAPLDRGRLCLLMRAPTATERGPLVGTTTKRAHRNVIGTHSGSYSVYRALAVAAGALSREHKADLTDTTPTDVIGPFPRGVSPAGSSALTRGAPWWPTCSPPTWLPVTTSAPPSPSPRRT